MEHIRMMELERYFAGELRGAVAERVRLHVEGCAECGRVLAEFEAERRRFLNVHPFAEFARSSGVVKDVNNVKKQRFAGRYGVIFATAAVLMLVPFALTTYMNRSVTDSGIRYKGLDRLSFMLMRDGEVRLGSPTETYRAGDRLQVVYSHPKSHHAALFSVDNAGRLSFYTGTVSILGGGNSVCSIPADSGSSLALPLSIVLDDSRGEELVVMLISKTPVLSENISKVVRRLSGGKYDNLSPIEDGLRRGGFGPDVSVSSVRIKKE